MRLMIAAVVLVMSFSAFAEKKSDLVDVSKDSKISDYLKKMNQKVTTDSEDVELDLGKAAPASKDKEKTSEEDILLQTASEKTDKSTSVSPVNKMMMAIFGLLFIAALFFAAIQKMGKKNGHNAVAKNIQILTQKSIGPKRNLMLIQVAGETILLGVTDSNINHIKTLSLLEDELPNYVDPKFSSQLKSKIDETKITDDIEEVDGFAVSRLADVKDAITQRFSR